MKNKILLMSAAFSGVLSYVNSMDFTNSKETVTFTFIPVQAPKMTFEEVAQQRNKSPNQMFVLAKQDNAGSTIYLTPEDIRQLPEKQRAKLEKKLAEHNLSDLVYGFEN